jgi:hypothetical protein
MEDMMTRISTLALITCIASFAAAPAAFAVSPSERECEGTFSRDQGVVSCTTDRGNAEQSADVKAGGQGNLNNKETCKGPGNSTAGC